MRRKSTDSKKKDAPSSEEVFAGFEDSSSSGTPLTDESFSAFEDSGSLDASAEPALRPSKAPAPKAPKDVYTLILLLGFLFFVAALVLQYMDLASYK